MVDSVLDEQWDSLWDRVIRYVNTDQVETKAEFRDRMDRAFFKEGITGDRDSLVDELWNYGIDNQVFPKVLVDEVTPLPERSRQKIKAYREQLGGTRWRPVNEARYTWKGREVIAYKSKGRFVTWEYSRSRGSSNR